MENINYCKNQIFILVKIEIFNIHKQLYGDERWKIFKRFSKDHQVFIIDGIKYILILSDCKTAIEIIEDDEGDDYSTSIGSSESDFDIDEYDSDDDSDYNDPQ